jgi:hypothetical protein
MLEKSIKFFVMLMEYTKEYSIKLMFTFTSPWNNIFGKGLQLGAMCTTQVEELESLYF